MGSWLCVSLGVWHPYKQANTVLWNHFGPRFLAPFFNEIVPASNFNKKAKLVTIVTFLTYLRLAYPSFKSELKAAIKHARELKRTTPLILQNLSDLRMMLEFFIPVVLFLHHSGSLILMCLRQVADYGCLLKMDNGRDVLTGQANLLRIFILIGGRQCSEYVRALTASLLLWCNWKKENHPCWQVFEQNANAFNEESGEIAFSVLARSCAKSVRADCNAVAGIFRRQKCSMELAADLNYEIACEDFVPKNVRRIKHDSAEVQATVAYFKSIIRQISAGTYRHYDDACGVLDKSARARGDARATVTMRSVDSIYRSVIPSMRQEMDGLQEVLTNLWVSQHKDIWPDSEPKMEFDSDTNGDDSAEDVSDEAAIDAKAARNKNRKRRAPITGTGSKRKAARTLSAFVDRVVAIPAVRFGKAWARENFKRYTHARLHGKITAFDDLQKKNKFTCTMLYNDPGYTILLEEHEIEQMLVPVDQELNVRDTPMVHD
jgi:hypothetical protein